jgi:hypothetical protein
MRPKEKYEKPPEEDQPAPLDSRGDRETDRAKPEKHDGWWSRADILSKVLSSVVIGAVGLMITWSIQKAQLSSTQSIANAQLEAARIKAEDDKKLEQGRVTGELLQHLVSKDAAQREIAIIALRESVPSGIYDSIVAVLARTDPSGRVRAAAIQELGKSNNSGVAHTLDAISVDQSRPASERSLALRSVQKLALASALAGNTYAFAASAGPAYESSGHGLFTGYLLKGLGGDADANKDGVITATELKHYLSLSSEIGSKVSLESGQRGVDLAIGESKQSPVAAFDGSGDHAVWGKHADYARIVALVIGVGQYTSDHHIRPPAYSVSDAESIARLLAADNRTMIKKLIDPTRSNVLAAMAELTESVSANDLLVVYFSGHGVLGADGVGQWLLADARVDSFDTYLSLSTVKHFLRQIPAKTKALYIDACFSGDGLATTR